MIRGIISFFRARDISTYPRPRVLALREKLLRRTLLHAYDNCPFYRELWEKARVTRSSLATVPLQQLPLVNKKMLMEHFEEVVTDRSATRKSVEDFFARDPAGTKLFNDKYVAIHTSGSSGFVGVFLFSKSFWSNLMGTVIARIFPLTLKDILTRSVRVAFIGEASGHHAGISAVNDIPFFKTLSVDVSWPQERIAREMAAFKPTVLIGYASGLAILADACRAGLAKLSLCGIISSGEPLSTDREQKIVEAFKIRPIDFYGATECLAMGASLHTSGVLDVFDDILYLEAVDDAGVSVAAGEPGRAVITLFGNDIFPLIRYTLDDEITIEPEAGQYSFTRIDKVTGRRYDRIKLTLSNGRSVEIHPMDLIGMFFPGLVQYQVVQKGPREVLLRMVVQGSEEGAQSNVSELVKLLMAEKGLKEGDIDLSFEFVDRIEPDPKTGKTPMIIPLKDDTAPNKHMVESAA